MQLKKAFFSVVLSAITASTLQASHGDFNSDGKADIVFEAIDGSIKSWFLSRDAKVGDINIAPPSETSTVVSEGDYNNDGYRDLLAKKADGSYDIWIMSATGKTKSYLLGDKGWSVVGSGDFNSDGYDDILWKRGDGGLVAWYMGASGKTSHAFLSGASGYDSIKGIADISGDGNADILVQKSNGNYSYWTMDAAGRIGGEFITKDLGKTVKGFADFDGNGYADILWKNTDGSTIIWMFDASGRTSDVSVTGPAQAAWSVVDVEDYDNDGQADILFKKEDNSLIIWFMGATGKIGKYDVSGDRGWTILPKTDTVGNDTNGTVKTEVANVEFTAITVPLVDQDDLSHTDSVSVDSVASQVDYTSLMTTGHADNGEIFGAVKDVNGNLITFTDGSPYICNGTNSGVGSGLDFTSILQRDNKLYMVSQFECSIGAMYMAEVEQNATSGIITPKTGTLQYIDQSSEFGGWTHCAGMVTPWQSHLGSEEYETNARLIEEGGSDTYYSELQKYWDTTPLSSVTPYYYGWTTETQIQSGSANYAKHYSMGRFSHELAYVMPDEKTVYMSDDGTNVGLYMFVADSEQDLSAGTLYAAKFTQTESYKGGAFDLSWISLGHTTDVEIRAMVASKPSFSDIFETAEPVCAATCPTGFTSVNTSWGHECLKVKPGQELMASRLETRRYAAILGATTEIRKEEGITYDPVHHRLYVAVSEVTYGMTQNDTYDKGGNNDITLSNNSCGAVYALDLESSVATQSNYSAKNFYAILYGETKDYSGTQYAGNSCDVDKISNPDNITYIPNSDILIISEDTSNHTNNMVWAYNVSDGDLRRIANVPLGAEASGVFWYKNINEFSYMTLVTQHPDADGESSVGLFSINSTLTQDLVLADNQTECEADGNTWNGTLNQCFVPTTTPDYSQPASFDTTTVGGSCYTTGNGVVFGSDFECGLSQPWYIYSVSSDIDWVVEWYGSYVAKITGYQADAPSDDWMISPKMTMFGDESLTFDYALNYSPSTCTVLISSDYNGTGDPSTATWDTIATYTTSLGNWNFVSEGPFDLSVYQGQEVYLAFRHTNAVTNQSGTWEIDNVVVSGSGSVDVPFQAAFSMSKTSALTTEYVEFTSSVSGGVAPYTYSWNMGDGNISTTDTFCYNYPTPGTYSVVLTVTDANGSIVISDAQQITISTPLDEPVPANAADIRVATFNSYLNRTASGELYTDLTSGTDTQIQNVAHIIQLVKPDIILINEFDYNGTANVDLFIQNYLNVAQGTEPSINYPYYYVAPSNTGIPTGLDVNNNGVIGTSGQDYGDDCYGFGEFPGQYALVVLSKYPIDTNNIRTFQKFLWKDMPSAYLPTNSDGSDYYSTSVLDIYRLSSKSHWDIPVDVNGKTVHILASHPTPPTFDDGDKDTNASLVDWNGLRNHDEIRLWADYIQGETYIYDDNNVSGGMAGDTRFVIVGDQNADPDEGDSYQNAIMQFMNHSLINASVAPTSLGATSEGESDRENDDTANWDMRADYVLPSVFGFEIDDCQVFWPQLNDVKHYLVEQTNGTENSSDHRLVWCDLNITDTNSTGSTPPAPTSELNTTFESGTFENWTPVSYSSTNDWQIANYGTYLLKATGYGDSSEVSDDWVVSPELSFLSGQTLTFNHTLNYSGSTCTVLVSTDYDGQGDPASATWTTITTYTTTSSGWTLVSAGPFDLSAYDGQTGYIAFRHTNATPNVSGTWEVDDIVVTIP